MTTIDGYFAEAPYPSMLHTRFTPGWITAATRRNGWQAPATRGRFHMLDIGCGDGTGLVLAAASHPGATFEGIDGMADHIATGQAFAGDLPNITLRQRYFADALADGGPPADLIAMHGIIAWVLPEIREQALDLAARRLAPGGVLAVSYNALPGWTSRLGYQHLMTRLANLATGTGDQRCLTAHEQLRTLAAAGFAALPEDVVEVVQSQIEKTRPDYLPHEYLNSGWQPLWGAEVRAAMHARGLSYLGQNEFIYVRPDLCLKAKQRAEIEQMTDPDLRETLMDMATDAPFRIDLYGKTPVRGAPDAFDETWLMADANADTEYVATLPSGTLRFDNPAARGILEALQDGPATLAMLAERLDMGLADIRNATDCLLLGWLAKPVSAPGDTPDAVTINRRLSAEALTPTGPTIRGLAGCHGPVTASHLAMGLLHNAPEEILNSIRNSTEMAARFLNEGVPPDDPNLPGDLAKSRARAHAELAARGVPLPDL